jgi:hypothetical protein
MITLFKIGEQKEYLGQGELSPKECEKIRLAFGIFNKRLTQEFF